MLELKRRALIVIGFAVLLVFTVACDETPVAVPPEMEEAVTDLVASVPDDALSIIQSLDSAFTSYTWESTMTLEAEDNAVPAQNMRLTWSSNAEEPAQQVVFAFEGGESAESPATSSITLTALSNEVYVAPEGEPCTVIPAEIGLDVAETLHDVFDPTRLVIDPGQLRRRIPNVEISGIEVAQFTFDESALGDLEAAGLEQATGNIFVAVDGQYIVRMELNGAGEINFDVFGAAPQIQNGQFRIDYNVVGTDDGTVIEAPAGCEAVELQLP
ncbi:MAG: hypothetical protein M9928_05730 [Anaerolineae bacterium]|nr:hypothetical protein [Anaerolineae bacterium]MCO5204509.1 hypothetical protein [Anaerolineae bacterium]